MFMCPLKRPGSSNGVCGQKGMKRETAPSPKELSWALSQRLRHFGTGRVGSGGGGTLRWERLLPQ